jgi:hypothetical protein
MEHLYFVAIVLGFPLVMLLLALVGGYLYRGRDAELLDWKPTRSPEREAELSINDIDQMRASLENLRRRRWARETLLR